MAVSPGMRHRNVSGDRVETRPTSYMNGCGGFAEAPISR
jgi:hypothetical protein